MFLYDRLVEAAKEDNMLEEFPLEYPYVPPDVTLMTDMGEEEEDDPPAAAPSQTATGTAAPDADETRPPAAADFRNLKR